MSQNATSLPRIPITRFNADSFNYWLSVWANNNVGYPGLLLRLYYADGSTQDFWGSGNNATADYFEFVFNVGSALQKDVTKMEIYGRYGWGRERYVLLFMWEGNTDNPVFKAGDAPSFKIRINTSYQIQSQQ